jgi:nicotinamidase-related amidase
VTVRGFDLTPANAGLLLIDMQERFLPAIPAMAEDQPCGRCCRILLAAAQLLGVPTTISEQYPQGLGATVGYLARANPAAVRMAKMHFSCADDPALLDHLERSGRRHLVLCGIEAQVCVLSTAADLLGRGFTVVIAGDAVASRNPAHVPMALAAARDLGALVVPTETIVMRLQRVAGSGHFKALAQLIR